MEPGIDYKQFRSKLPASKFFNQKTELDQARKKAVDVIIVLDDDPTGTQTVYNIPVLTNWEFDTILAELSSGTPLFYILTNSRSLTEEKAIELTRELAKTISLACSKAGKTYWVISRSDSTLRGHYPAEIIALESVQDADSSVQFLIPAFFEGGRLTLQDVHYCLSENVLIPVSNTPYAQDKVFGFSYSNLKDWIREKYGTGNVQVIDSITLDDLRINSLEILIKKIHNLRPGTKCIVNAENYADLKIFSLALCKSTVSPIFRTAASFVAAILNQPPKENLTLQEINHINGKGSLTVVGSYVPNTSRQLDYLLKSDLNIAAFELDVDVLLKSNHDQLIINNLASQMNNALKENLDVVLYTSRKLVYENDDQKNQWIGQQISQAIVVLVQSVQFSPRYIMTKGGITSSDVATKALEIRRALVIGQIIPGVPVWELGMETKFPGLKQIIFPGNVGTSASLKDIIERLSTI